jgi:hypothetical protein
MPTVMRMDSNMITVGKRKEEIALSLQEFQDYQCNIIVQRNR